MKSLSSLRCISRSLGLVISRSFHLHIRSLLQNTSQLLLQSSKIEILNKSYLVFFIIKDYEGQEVRVGSRVACGSLLRRLEYCGMGYQSWLCLCIELIKTICSVGLTLLRGLRSATVSGGESERTYLELGDSN